MRCSALGVIVLLLPRVPLLCVPPPTPPTPYPFAASAQLRPPSSPATALAIARPLCTSRRSHIPILTSPAPPRPLHPRPPPPASPAPQEAGAVPVLPSESVLELIYPDHPMPYVRNFGSPHRPVRVTSESRPSSVRVASNLPPSRVRFLPIRRGLQLGPWHVPMARPYGTSLWHVPGTCLWYVPRTSLWPVLSTSTGRPWHVQHVPYAELARHGSRRGLGHVRVVVALVTSTTTRT